MANAIIVDDSNKTDNYVAEVDFDSDPAMTFDGVPPKWDYSRIRKAVANGDNPYEFDDDGVVLEYTKYFREPLEKNDYVTLRSNTWEDEFSIEVSVTHSYFADGKEEWRTVGTVYLGDDMVIIFDGDHSRQHRKKILEKARRVKVTLQ